MDLRAFYQKIRRIAAEIMEDAAVIISRETPDGGRAGVKTEVPREVAARHDRGGEGRSGESGSRRRSFARRRKRAGNRGQRRNGSNKCC